MLSKLQNSVDLPSTVSHLASARPGEIYWGKPYLTINELLIDVPFVYDRALYPKGIM